MFRRTRGNKALTEDLCQDVWLRVYQNIQAVRQMGVSPAAWILRVARNRHVDYIKSGQARMERAMLDDPDGGWQDDPRDAVRSAEDEAMAASVTTTIQNALSVLAREGSEEQARCLTLRFIHGWPIPDVSKELGISHGAVKALQYRAIRRLRTMQNIQELARAVRHG